MAAPARRTVGLGLATLLALGICAAPGMAKSSGHPLTGRYKATPSSGAAFDFRVANVVCPRQGRGGNQHQRKGYCFVPGTEPTFDLACPSGYVLHNDSYALFNALLTSAGKLSSPAVSSNGEIGTFKLTVDAKGRAKGYYEVTWKRPTDDITGATETCSTGRITFTAKRG